MENIIFDKWIEIKKGVKVRIKRKTNSDNSSVLMPLRARCIKSDVGSSPPPFKCIVGKM